MSLGQIAWMALVAVIALAAIGAFLRVDRLMRDGLTTWRFKLETAEKDAEVARQAEQHKQQLDSMTIADRAEAERAKYRREAAIANRQAQEELLAKDEKLKTELADSTKQLNDRIQPRHAATVTDSPRHRIPSAPQIVGQDFSDFPDSDDDQYSGRHQQHKSPPVADAPQSPAPQTMTSSASER